MLKNKNKVLFVFDHKYENTWRDGLWAALNILKSDFNIQFHNLQNASPVVDFSGFDFILGWGGFNSPVDNFLHKLKDAYPNFKYGLCIGGNAFPPVMDGQYDVLFYETHWYEPQLESHPNKFHAFGVNTNIYHRQDSPIIWDWLSVGSFSYWKRHHKILAKNGTKMVIGEIQRDNWQESFDIISDLLLGGAGVSDMLYPTKLRDIYNSSAVVYIPAEVNGGGERAVLEARACGRPVEIEKDNDKLKELLNCPLWDERYYASQLKKGIESCL